MRAKPVACQYSFWSMLCVLICHPHLTSITVSEDFWAQGCGLENKTPLSLSYIFGFSHRRNLWLVLTRQVPVSRYCIFLKSNPRREIHTNPLRQGTNVLYDVHTMVKADWASDIDEMRSDSANRDVAAANAQPLNTLSWREL